MAKLEVEGIMNDDEIRWKKIDCSCSKKKDDVANQFPIKACIHCQFQLQENSMPKKQFEISFSIMDKDGKPTGKTEKKTIKKIKIHRGEKYQEILGWYNLG
tara:strand:- start:100 stop:402 length:303 start_codon:yes stop_codon:yes gene_type:complete